jgi:hypothetical protein
MLLQRSLLLLTAFFRFNPENTKSAGVIAQSTLPGTRARPAPSWLGCIQDEPEYFIYRGRFTTHRYNCSLLTVIQSFMFLYMAFILLRAC